MGISIGSDRSELQILPAKCNAEHGCLSPNALVEDVMIMGGLRGTRLVCTFFFLGRQFNLDKAAGKGKRC